jgi:UDP-glucose:(heptosyl)LPS alpha-1,3-glucosyltransferase
MRCHIMESLKNKLSTHMKLAFTLFKYFPYGGLQRDFLHIAKTCLQRGHEVHVFTMQWEGEEEPGLHLHLIPARGQQNHVRNQSFVENVKKELDKLNPDVVMGFNKMPYLDIYYAADVCYLAQARERHGFPYRLLPRHRALAQFEKAVFNRGHATQIFLISKREQQTFQHYYQTELERFHLLPPGLSRDRISPPHAPQIRASLRKAYHLAQDDILLLLVGSGFKTKGLDRALFALKALPTSIKKRTQLFVIGQDNPNLFIKLANKLKISKQVKFLGGRPDVPDFLLAADLLIHPAYYENAGMVLLEAMVSGLPVLTVDVCGYAHYVKDFNAGMVLSSPFQQLELNMSLQKMLSSALYPSWQENGLAFAKNEEIYSLPKKTADLIELIGEK